MKHHIFVGFSLYVPQMWYTSTARGSNIIFTIFLFFLYFLCLYWYCISKKGPLWVVVDSLFISHTRRTDTHINLFLIQLISYLHISTNFLFAVFNLISAVWWKDCLFGFPFCECVHTEGEFGNPGLP